MAIHRIRKYRELFRQEIATLAASPAQVESEWRFLAAVRREVARVPSRARTKDPLAAGTTVFNTVYSEIARRANSSHRRPSGSAAAVAAVPQEFLDALAGVDFSRVDVAARVDAHLMEPVELASLAPAPARRPSS